MDVEQAIRLRRTVRGFKKKPVPEHTLRKILDAARLSPSNCNTQPWHLTIASGKTRDRLEKALIEEVLSGKAPNPAFGAGDKELTGIYKERQYDCASRYYGTMGINRKDTTARQELALKNWSFFGAPHVGVLSMPRTMRETNALDLGIYLQSIMLLMVENEISCCPQAALALFPDPILNIMDIPKENGIICGLSFGFEDSQAQINQVKMERAPLENSVKLLY